MILLELNRGLQVYRQVLANGFYHLPLFLVVDLLTLLDRGYEVRFRSEIQGTTDIADSDDGFDHKLIMRYERECLGRVLQSPDVTAAFEITATSANPEKITERLLLQILKKIAPNYPQATLVNPGLLRNFQSLSPDQIEQYDGSEFLPAIEIFLGELNANLNWSKLLYEEDIFELSHIDSLSTDHLRFGCRQILEVSRLLRSTALAQLDLANHEDGADTAFLDETHYPTGGLAGLTNRGSFENLLTSELVYLDEGTKDVSLFELRYAEGELLYYLRDAGNLRRKRRSIHFVLDAADVFESKLPGYRWQYSVLLQGFCLRLLHDLFELFEMDALRFHFHYIKSPKVTAVEQEFFDGEIGVMKTVLADYTKHEWVTFDTWDKALSPETLIDPKRKSYAVLLAGPKALNHWRTLLEQIDAEEIPIHTALVSIDDLDADSKELSFPRIGLSNSEIMLLKDSVLERLVS